MTPKENLYLKLLTTKNELYKVEGKSERIINLAEFVDTREFKRNVRTFKVNELKEQIESAKKKAERLVWFAKVAIIVKIIQFPPLIKPNFRRLCHYCATKNGTFGHKNVVCKNYHFTHHVDFQLVTSRKDA